jgi:phospholipase/lecithinase/hemolysin
MLMGLRRMTAVGAVLTGALLAACGGGSDRVEPFAPTRLLAFGDETSALTADGHNWGVNGVNATTSAFDCTLNPNWVQLLALRFGMAFAQCPTASLPLAATVQAEAGWKVADVATQVAGVGALGAKDLVTILIGANDILEQYALYPTSDEATLSDELKARGAKVAGLVNRLADAGGRILVVTVPDLGLTPFAIAEKAARADTDRAALLTRLTTAFNKELRLNIVNDGSRIGLVLGDEMVQGIVKLPAGNGFVDVTQVVCTTAPPACTSATLVTNGQSFTWLWADATRLSAGGHARLGATAEARARSNPF